MTISSSSAHAPGTSPPAASADGTLPEGERLLTITEAVAIAIECQKNEHFESADALFRKVLEVVPDHPDALHYSGVLAQQLGRSDEAVALISRSLEMAPEQADWHSNLGVILQSRGRLDEAIASYERAISLNPKHSNAYSNLGVLLRATGRLEQAESAYRTAIELNPENPDCYHNLGVLLSATGRTPEAVTYYCKALTLKPEYAEARRLLALAYCVIDQRDKAVQVCKQWLEDEPGDPIALHTLAACSNRDVPVRASNAYVEKTFDNFAASFEVKLAKLKYRAPALVAERLSSSGLDAVHGLDVLDAGCGTGLCGPLIAPFARRLVGVDLSTGMLEHAREKQVYDELVRAELTEFLQQHPGAFDVIVSADTLVYFGSLESVVAAAAGALRDGGVVIFTVEEEIAPDAGDFGIKPHGRYNHRSDYVERVLLGVGLSPDVARAELRLESGVPVQGLVVRAWKRRRFGDRHA